MIEVEIENRSRASVDAAGRRGAGARRARRGRCRGRRARDCLRRGRRDARAQAGAPRNRRARPTSSRSRSTGSSRCPRASPGRSGTSSSAPRWSARSGGGRSCTACSTCSATSTDRRWTRGSARTCRDHASSPALDLRELQLRDRGDHPRAPHAAEHAHPLRRGCRGARGGARVRRLSSRADRALDRDRLRADRGDDQHGGRGGRRRRVDVVRPDGEAGEGHRGRVRC